VYSVLEKSDVDVRKELVTNAMLTGGGSLFRGLGERLEAEVKDMLPAAYKVRCDAMGGSVTACFCLSCGAMRLLLHGFVSAVSWAVVHSKCFAAVQFLMFCCCPPLFTADRCHDLLLRRGVVSCRV
jgi:actin, other eukaryote